jgi:hypothetical protein
MRCQATGLETAFLQAIIDYRIIVSGVDPPASIPYYNPLCLRQGCSVRLIAQEVV